MICPHCAHPSAGDEDLYCSHCGAPLRDGSASTALDVRGRRFAAALIDVAVVAVILTIIAVLTMSTPSHVLLALAVPAFYKALFESSPAAATPGKRLLGLKVVRTDGTPLSLGRALARGCAADLAGLFWGLPYLMYVFTPRRQALHDYIADTVVADARASAADVRAYRAAGHDTPVALVIAIVGGFAAIFVIGLLAAIAIPAYQDYTLRAQVAEGITLAQPYEIEVGRLVASGRALESIDSETLAEAAPSSGRYVDSVRVRSGTVIVRYGRAANPRIAGHTLAFEPVAGSDGNVAWVCGYRAESRLTDVPSSLVPLSCRAP